MCTVSVLSCVCQLFIKEFHDDDDDDEVFPLFSRESLWLRLADGTYPGTHKQLKFGVACFVICRLIVHVT